MVETQSDYMPEVKEIDFSEIYSVELAAEYVEETAEKLAGKEDLEKVIGANIYVDKVGLPGRPEMGVQALGTELRYNEDIVEQQDVYEVLSEFGENRVPEEHITELLEQTEE